MKVAFLFSGQLRGFPIGIHSLVENLFFNFDDYDTFFYIPNDANDAKVLFNSWNPTSATVELDQHHEEISGFNNTITYSDGKMQYNGYTLKGRMQHYYLQWYGVKRVFELMESYRQVNNIHYDLVFRIRADFYFRSKFFFSPFEGIQIPTHSLRPGSFYDNNQLYDRLAFGSYEHMKWYCSLYDHLKDYKDRNGPSEAKLKEHVDVMNIPIRYVDMDYVRINMDGTLQGNPMIDPG